MDAEENARRASRGRTGANFRAKTGGVGDVLERGGVPGADYNAEVAAPSTTASPWRAASSPTRTTTSSTAG